MEKIIDLFTSDQQDAVTCHVKGTLPDWLSGSLYRNGAALYHIGSESFNHLFDGMAVLHQFTITPTSVQYRNHLLQTETFKRNKRAGKIVVDEFGTLGCPDPCESIFTRYFSYYLNKVVTDNTCVNVLMLYNELCALTETTEMNLIDVQQLDVQQKVSLQKVLPIMTTTAHPLQDEAGTWWNIGTSYTLHSKYCVYKLLQVDKQQQAVKTDLICEIACCRPTEPSYYHSFGMSDNYIVLIEQTQHLSLLQLATYKFRRVNIADCMSYYHTDQCRFHVVSKVTGQCLPVEFVAESFFVFHHINTFELEEHIVVDVCAYQDGSIMFATKLATLRQGNTVFPLSQLYRFVLPLNPQNMKCGVNLVSIPNTTATCLLQTNGTLLCTPEIFSDCVVEFPAVSTKLFRKEYRYLFGIRTVNTTSSSTQLMKYDILKRELLATWSLADHIVVEPVFVGQPDAVNEDDGVLLSPVISTVPDQPSFLLILDARTFVELARADLPPGIHMPFSFHGSFVP